MHVVRFSRHSAALACAALLAALAAAVPLSLIARGASAPVTGASKGDLRVRAALAAGPSVRAATAPRVSINPPAAMAGGVRIEPAGGTAYQNRPQTFTVWNTGTATATYTITTPCDGGVTGCTASAGSVTLAPTASAQVTVTYASSGPGTVRLTATSGGETASGWVSVASLPASVGTAPFLSYPVRHLCTTLALPGGAASECGDLRLAHALPAVRTMNRGWMPVLLYNSALAQPRFRYVQTLTAPSGSAGIDSVAQTVTLPDRTLERQKWNGVLAPGSVRRLVYSAGATDLPTGLYAATVQTKTWRGGVESATSQQFEVAFVNRAGSRFGGGWWLAGLEALYDAPGGRKLWVSGDGSVAIYHPATDSTWVAPNGERPDTLKRRVNTAGKARLVRLIPGGAHVVFSDSGRHDSTVTRTGLVTAFAYGANGLATITVPGGPVYTFEYGGTTRPRVIRVRLDSDTLRRTVELGAGDNDPRLRSITDPDGGVTTLVYPCCDTIQKRVIQRMDPMRRSWATYTYDAIGKVKQGEVDMGTPGTSDDVVVAISPGESRGAAPVAAPFDSVYTRVDGPRPDGDVADVTRFWIAPTLDTSVPQRIVDALGNETVLTYGDARFENLVTRMDGPVMGDGTRQTAYAAYDARGNVTSSVVKNPLGDGRDATTRYGRSDLRWPDFVTHVTQPMGETVYIGYDAAGNRQYQQDGRGAPSTVYFGYNAQGQMTWTQDQVGAMALMGYDAAGNLNLVHSPRGMTSLFYADALGQDTLAVTPVDSLARFDGSQVLATGTRVITRYDAMGRPTLVTTIGKARGELVGDGTYRTAPAETLFVKTDYNAVGQADSVARWSGPDVAGVGRLRRRWAYDNAGRAVADTAEDGRAESFLYDLAGNVTARITRLGDTIRTRYDALGRVASRRAGGRSYPTQSISMNTQVWTFPRYVNDAAGRFETSNSGFDGFTLNIPAQLDTFTYDPAGRMTSAVNADAQVLRNYYPGGALKTETQRIATYGHDGWHDYALGYEYDLGGRRTRLSPPAGLSSSPVTYLYDSTTGELKTISGHGGTFEYLYTLRGQLRQLTRGTGDGLQTQEEWTYDQDGQMLRRHELASSAVIHSDTFTYDGRGKVLETRSANWELTSQFYSGIGSLLWARTDRPAAKIRTEETYAVDALANRATMQVQQFTYMGGFVDTSPPEQRRYRYNAGRMVTDTADMDNGTSRAATENSFDPAGNVERVFSSRPAKVVYPYPGAPSNATGSTASLVEVTRQYYDADNRLRVVDRQSCLFYSSVCYNDRAPYYEGRPAFEEYRYDALGRRVLVRSRADLRCTDRCRKTLQRTIWDGDQVLIEISAPGGTGTASSVMEADTGLARYSPFNRDGFFYGRVLYVHGQGIDQPLALVRYEYSDSIPGPIMLLPHVNSRGGVDSATYVTPCFAYTVTLTRDPDSTATVNSPPPSQHCVQAPYPGRTELTSHENVAQDRYGPISWMGSLIVGSRDGSGQMYMRNRYYDPRSGRFTQEDPIGLAGGVNLYGFAAGDAVSYSDPYGLAPCPELPCRSADDPMRDRPLPPGIDEQDVTWDPAQRWYVHDNDGRIIRPHPADPGHWDHWEVYPGGNGRPSGPGVDFPDQNKKMWPGQKTRPYGAQSPTDPWLDVPGARMFRLHQHFREGLREQVDRAGELLNWFRESFEQVDPRMLIPSPVGVPIPAFTP